MDLSIYKGKVMLIVNVASKWYLPFCDQYCMLYLQLSQLTTVYSHEFIFMTISFAYFMTVE